LTVGGKQAVVVESRTQDAEAAVEIRKVVFEVHAGAAEEPDFLSVLAGPASIAGDSAKQEGKGQSDNGSFDHRRILARMIW
jgi:hypothetical protein